MSNKFKSINIHVLIARHFLVDIEKIFCNNVSAELRNKLKELYTDFLIHPPLSFLPITSVSDTLRKSEHGKIPGVVQERN